MKQLRYSIFRFLLVLIFLAGLLSGSSIAQTVVGLDNWFNRETNAKTGQPFHYLWTDTEWSGYSRWGEIFTSMGAKITTIDKPLPPVLKSIDVFIIVDPDTTTESPAPNYIMSNDINAIKKWVKKGGVLAILANDAPNCEFTHLNSLMTYFGMHFNHVSLHPVPGTDFEMGASTAFEDHPVFKEVSKIYIKEVSDISLSRKARPLLTENGKVLIAETDYGKGYVFAIGDPWIYNEYIDHDRLPSGFENRKAAENLTRFLLGKVKK
jgi:unsaturated rhamnogalacturonyl hydrolase